MSVRAKKKVSRGFTLIELVIVIAVIAILAALLVPTILGQADRARVSRAKGDVVEIAKAVARMRNDTGATAGANPNCFPNTPAGLSTILSSATVPAADACGAGLAVCNPNNPGMTCWGGPYLSSTIGVDPWGTAYQIAVDTNSSSVTITSFGPNKAAGGTPTNDDIIATQ